MGFLKVGTSIIHLRDAQIDFKCPYCKKQYIDSDEQYYNRMRKSKWGRAHIKCDCGKWMWLVADMTSKLHTY